MKLFITSILPLIFLLAASCASPPDRRPPAGEAYRSFTGDGAWCWFSDPRAVYFEGQHQRTYSGWVDSTGNIVVGFIDHRSGEIATHVLHENLEKDDHNNPSFFIGEDGKLMVFYSRHATGNSPMFVAFATEPESISDWEPVRALRLNDTIAYEGFSNTYTYTNIARLAEEEGKMFLFWRGADYKPNFSVSDDGGRSWDEGGILVLPERTYKNRRPYLKVATNHRDVIHFAFTDGHPHVEPTNSIYYARYRDGSLLKANGDRIMSWDELPMDPARADVVYDATETNEKAWIWDVAENSEGNPVVVYARFPTDTTHVYYYGIFDDGQWHNYKLLDSGPWFPKTRPGVKEREPNYSGGIVLDHQDPSRVYLSRKRDGVFEIEQWVTSDKGKSWDTKEVTAGSVHDNVRPFVIRNHPGDSLTLLWMNLRDYTHYTDYDGSIRMNVEAAPGR